MPRHRKRRRNQSSRPEPRWGERAEYREHERAGTSGRVSPAEDSDGVGYWTISTDDEGPRVSREPRTEGRTRVGLGYTKTGSTPANILLVCSSACESGAGTTRELEGRDHGTVRLPRKDTCPLISHRSSLALARHSQDNAAPIPASPRDTSNGILETQNPLARFAMIMRTYPVVQRSFGPLHVSCQRSYTREYTSHPPLLLAHLANHGCCPLV
jgi:hypothetical protein